MIILRKYIKMEIKMRKKLLCVGLATMLAVSSLIGCGSSSTGENVENGSNIDVANMNVAKKDYGLSEDIKDGAILQCFCWSFNTISESMEDIAAAGFSAIQTSPINAVYDGGNAGMELFGEGKWSYVYQPTEWTIGNYQLGTEAEFKKMCNVAESYGIKVIIDVVPNHTTPTLDAVSDKFIEAVGGKDKMYHSDGMKDIEDYGNRKQCTLQGVGGLPDVDTENEAFQEYFLAYLNKCISDGADGFRYDTAKHIGLPDDPKDKDGDENNFWDILGKTEKAEEIFNYGEVLQGSNDRLEDYIDTIGATTASSYGMNMRLSITSESVAAEEVKDMCIKDENKSVVTWVESHDNYCGDDNSYNISNEDISLAWAIITARDKGTPLFFSRPYGSTVENKWGTMNRIGCAGDFIYKNAVVSAANHFRNAMKGETENIYNPESNTDVVCIERGKKGLVIVNAGSKDVDTKFLTALVPGKYCDRADGSTEYTVNEDGELSCKIKAKSAIVLYNEGYKELGKKPEVKVEDGTLMKITEDSVDVTLKASNVKNATYSINGSKQTAYEDGTKIKIGENMSGGDTTSLTLRGESEEGNTTCMTYVFSKKQGITKGTKVYFEKPANWNKEVYAYVYDETSSSQVKYNEQWPGAKMEEEDGKYCYTFTEEWSAPLIIFTDGDNQSNGAMEPGANVEPDKVYSIDK